MRNHMTHGSSAVTERPLTPEPIMTQPQAIIVEHPVANFETWKTAFDGLYVKRKE